LQSRNFISFFLAAVPIIIELVSLHVFLSIAVPSPVDGYFFKNIDHTVSKIIRTNDINTNDTGSAAKISSANTEQRNNNTSITLASVLPESATSRPSSPLLLFNDNTCITYDSVNRTINLCGGSANLSTIDQVINRSDVLNRTSNKNWMLNADISVESPATLFINSTDAEWLRINSTAGRAYAIVVYGNLIIDRTRISSWNSTNKAETTLRDGANESTPRGYLLMHWAGTGQMNITNSNITNLGSHGIKDTWGIAYYSGSGSKLQNNTISSNFRGIHFAANASNILVANNSIQNSSQHGLNLYKVKGTRILDNQISSNYEHGIICTAECMNTLIESNFVYDNGRNGIVLNHGTIYSDVRQNVIKENNRSGIAIWNSSANAVDNNQMQHNGLGLAISRNSSHNIVSNNSIIYSLSNGILLDVGSTENRIEENLIANSRGTGLYIRNASDNILIGNEISQQSRNGLVLSNASRNELVSNNVSANSPYNYYMRSNSKSNIIRDTHFDNATLRFFDNSTNIILENTDNRITSNNKRDLIRAYSTNATLLLEPVTKNALVNTLDMFVIPSKENVEIFSISKDFDTNQKYKRWFEKSPVLFASASEDKKKASTRYIVGSFAPDTQIIIRVNNSFWNAYTSNSSGYIDFVYDGYEERSTSEGELEVNGDLKSNKVLEFEAEQSNRPTIAVVTLFSALIAGSIGFIIIRRYLQKKKGDRNLGSYDFSSS
jgi:parallel beta-helix repeat protein